MKIRLVSMCVALCMSHCALAQEVALLRPLTAEDYRALDVQIKGCFEHSADIAFTLKSSDFGSAAGITPDKPSSLRQVKELEKQLKGNFGDAVLYNNIGKIYEKLLLPEKAAASFDKGLAIALKYKTAHPDSAAAHSTLGIIYTNQGKLDEAVIAFQQAVTLNPADSASLVMIPFCHLFAGNAKGALAAIDTILQGQPSSSFYHFMRVLALYLDKMKRFQQMDAAGMARAVKDKRPEELMDLSVTQASCARYPEQPDFRLLCRVARHLGIYMKSAFLTMTDTSVTGANIKFILEAKDRQELDDLEAFYRNYLEAVNPPAAYIVNKALANVLLMKGLTREALPFLEQTITLKPVSKSTFDDNAAEDYDNLAAAFHLLNDTTAYENAVARKIRVQPAINPLPTDFMSLARIAFTHGRYAEAEKQARLAARMDPALRADALVCRAAILLLERKAASALQLVDSIYAIDPNRPEMYLLMGVAMLHNNDAATAWSVFQKARTLYSKTAWLDDGIINRYFAVPKRR